MSFGNSKIVQGDFYDDDDTDTNYSLQLRSVKLNEINLNSFVNIPNRHVLVKVLWRSDKPPPDSTNQPCRFILSDETGHIAAILFLNENIHAVNVYNLLKPSNKILQLKNFSVQEAKENYRLIKNQAKELNLSQSTLDLKEIEIGIITRSESFLSHLPIHITSLKGVDEKQTGSFVDVIGHAKYISYELTSKKKNVQYQKVILSTHSSFSLEVRDEQFLRYLTLFDGHIDKIKAGVTYILQNVKVDYFKFDNSKSIKTTALTIAHKIDNVEGMRTLLPATCLPLPEIETLFSSESSSRAQVLAIRASSSTNVGSLKRSLSPHLSQRTAFHKLQKVESVGSQSQSTSDIENTYVQSEDDNEDESDCEDFPDISYDFINSKTPLVVQVKSANVFKGTTKKAYTMRSRSKSRGIALIINNYFPEDTDKARKGSLFDASYMEKFLRTCSFDVYIKNDITSKELPTTLTDFKSRATNETDCCFVAVLSHGSSGGIEMADGEVVNLHSEIIYQFDDFNFPFFKDKPKVFVIQACQNIPTLESVQSLRKRNSEGKYFLDNTIVCNATIPEVSAVRDIYLGSPFIYVLVHTLMNHAHDRHLKDILDEVHKRLNKVQREECGPLNCCYTVHGFKKLLYFNPGL